jgi:hypothetical protein
MTTHRLFAGFLALVAALGAAGSHGQNLVTNGDFEAGLTGWTTWAAPPSTFWDGSWIHSNDCDIWVPTNGCPYEGTTSHAQKKGSGAGNAHGGIYQTLSVTAGETYEVNGYWSGGVRANLDGNNGTWWEVVVYDGTPTDAEIDAGFGADDTLIAKRESNNLASGAVFQFQWEPFSGTFTAPSDTVTLAFKTGSFYTLEAAGYHDAVTVTAASAAPVPALPVPLLALLALAVAALAARGGRARRGG